MAERTRRIWALVVAAALGLAGTVADGRGAAPKKPSLPKPLGTPKSPVKLPACALWLVPAAHVPL
ncbi:MAG: hypothetical protein QM765_01525 [Myxococcales bacterium]